MGAQTFSQVASGISPAAAFKAAVEQARYDYGHAGYTGTLAEKHDFVIIHLPPEQLEQLRAKDYPYLSYDHEAPHWQKVDDKWGPAGCVQLDTNPPGQLHKYLFFGWASS
jgi:hypothetical protein